MPVTFYGIIARIISIFIPIKKNNWIFGSDYGNTYREGSRYLIEYMLSEHPEFKCTFITKNRSVKDVLNEKGIPCEMNMSLRGMIAVAKASVVFTTQSASDILFVYKKKRRKYIFLSHGQPYKAVFLATPKEYTNQMLQEVKGLKKVAADVSRYFTTGYEYWDSELYTSTSDFLIPYNKLYYGKNANVQVLGMPRNDVLFDSTKMSLEKWLPGMNGKFVITYMPTHRKFGAGFTSPIPFKTNPVVQEWMRLNNVVLLVKQHPNMANKVEKETQDDVIIDITKKGIDPQVCLFHSDALITDYSSVWIDYLILKRPLMFYYYDDFEDEDTGVLYDIREEPPGVFCYSEDQLFENIKLIRNDYESMRPSNQIVSKYHKYVDGNSCERFYKAIVKG